MIQAPASTPTHSIYACGDCDKHLFIKLEQQGQPLIPKSRSLLMQCPACGKQTYWQLEGWAVRFDVAVKRASDVCTACSGSGLLPEPARTLHAPLIGCADCNGTGRSTV